MPTTTVSEWGPNLRTLRRRREISASGVARRAGISRYYLYRVEMGEYVPSDDVRGRLLAALRHFGATDDELTPLEDAA